MKMYVTPYGTLSENMIDPVFRDQGLASGAVTEREATYDEALAECRRRRRDAILSAFPMGDQLDADWHQRQGNLAPRQAIDAGIAAIKAQFPKPAPVS